MWCRDHNRAGRLLNDQLQNLDNFCLMNHPQVWTTINKTEIDLSILPVDMVPLTDLSIYPGLLSNNLAVLLEMQHQHNTERVSVLKKWLTEHADWELYREYITTATTNIEWTYIDTNEANITNPILEAAELSIPKSSGKHQQHHTGRTTWELGWPSTVKEPMIIRLLVLRHYQQKMLMSIHHSNLPFQTAFDRCTLKISNIWAHVSQLKFV